MTQITDKQMQSQNVDNQQSIQKSSISTDDQEPTVANRLFGFFKNVTSPWSEETSTNDWDNQNSPIQLPSEEPLIQQTVSSPSSLDNFTPIIRNKLQQITSKYPDLFPNSNGDILEDLDQLTSIIKTFQNQIKQLQKYVESQKSQMM
jgi:hypothetical protein